MTDVIFSPVLSQHWLEMLFNGSYLRMAKELGSCCGLCETDMHWERTSQVPELGFLCQPAIPAARPRACWQESSQSFPPAMSRWLHSGKSREEVTDHICSLLLAGFHFLSPFLRPSFLSEPIEIRTSQQKTSKTGSILSVPIAHKA